MEFNLDDECNELYGEEFLRSFQSLSSSKNSQHSMELESLLPCSQKPFNEYKTAQMPRQVTVVMKTE
jgi:hypothetical protein